MARTSNRAAVFDPLFLDDLRYWVRENRSTALKALQLVDAIMADPFVGIGKPEPLKHELAGDWSRRITSEHRLIYRVYSDRIAFLQARYHYASN